MPQQPRVSPWANESQTLQGGNGEGASQKGALNGRNSVSRGIALGVFIGQDAVTAGIADGVCDLTQFLDMVSDAADGDATEPSGE